MPTLSFAEKPRNTRVAYARDARMHAVVRRSFAEAEATPETLNPFFKAKDVYALLTAIDSLPPLGGHKAVDVAPRGLAAPDEGMLLQESFLAPAAKPEGDDPWAFTTGRAARSAAREAAAGLAIEDGFFDGGPCVVEPLHDWLFLRNLLIYAMRIAAEAAGGRGGSVLERAGFAPVEPSTRASRRAMGGPGYVAPIAYNPFFSRPAVDLTWDDAKVWPLYSKLTEADQTALEKATGFTSARHLKGCPEAKLLTSVQVDRAEAGAGLRKTGEPEARWVYLALESVEAEGQAAAAERFMRAIDGLFGCDILSLGGDPGTELVREARPSGLAEAAWAVVKDHPGYELACCRRCGRAFFAPQAGRQAVFCSQACRSAFNKA